MSTVIVDQALEQRDRALAKANVVRSWRKQLKANIANGHMTVSMVLEVMPPEVRSMKVSVLLMALPGFAEVKVNRALGTLGVPQMKPVGELSVRQRNALLRWLDGR